ncbi:2-dehydro-3-deoxy-6-phosphogalactonate aldolase [Undibacterium sp. RuTC16W]|uniref:2-dehydro-3-deoxy-6-phosphogalactonate aldolase n=1 Tax=Undibacterium sp. RuTC16W TaxID=3413048 RepID=UPI003BF3B4EF
MTIAKTTLATLDSAFKKLPLIAILRGVQTHEVKEIAWSLYEEGFRLIEVPLNSPDALASIAELSRCMPEDALIGAGTVLSSQSVIDVQQAGGRLIVMPHADVQVIAAAKRAGMYCVPGAVTPTEIFAALQAGADAIKLFPAELIAPHIVKAMRAVLPASLKLLPVGGVNPFNMKAYLAAGAAGFGLGGALYAPGANAATVAANARAFVQSFQSIQST